MRAGKQRTATQSTRCGLTSQKAATNCPSLHTTSFIRVNRQARERHDDLTHVTLREEARAAADCAVYEARETRNVPLLCTVKQVNRRVCTRPGIEMTTTTSG